MAERTPQPLVDAIYDVLARAHAALAELGVKHFVVAGTLLGAERHGGLIPHDDDADLMACEADLRALPRGALEGALRAHGLDARAETYEGQTLMKLRAAGDERERHWCVDLFPYESVGGALQPLGYSARVNLPQLVVEERAVFPLREYAFGPLRLPGPRDADAALRAFPEWRTEMRVWNHLGHGETVYLQAGRAPPPALPSRPPYAAARPRRDLATAAAAAPAAPAAPALMLAAALALAATAVALLLQ
jgi:hypothetical protein